MGRETAVLRLQEIQLDAGREDCCRDRKAEIRGLVVVVRSSWQFVVDVVRAD